MQSMRYWNSALFLMAVCLPAGTGCSYFRAKRLEVHPGVERIAGMAELREGEFDRQRFDEVFPPIDRIRLSSRVVAQQYRFLGKTIMHVSLVSEGARSVRMRARHPGDNTVLFDLLTRGEHMSIYVPSAGTVFEGEIKGGRSPFGESYGIEPWDMVSILSIGRRLIEGEFRTKKGFWTLTLRPTDEEAFGDGLRRVDLDRKTRLPIAAYWEREGGRWTVIYERWETTPSESDGGRDWLVPSRFVIMHRRPRVRVEVTAREGTRQFRINPQLAPRTFELPLPAGSERRPLYELGEALQAQ